ncbi:MAG: helix-hairpin-helix domain-containing protein [Lachnospiraceae bacterium]|nr:helix-hairpin-helix domain-containing protein [Lachnospiraceae bacterium]
MSYRRRTDRHNEFIEKLSYKEFISRLIHNEYIKKLGALLLCCLILGIPAACAGKNTLYVSEDGYAEDNEAGDADTENGTLATAEVSQGGVGNGNVAGDAGTENGQERNLVHVCGAVISPGVYEIQAGDRVADCIEMAGGFTDDAGRDALNLALSVADGMKVYVPTVEECVSGDFTINDTGVIIAGGNTTGVLKSDDNTTAGGDSKGLININTAGEEQLTTLTGIGKSRAASIIAYREEHGGFATIEDIMKVPGIKQSSFNKIKDKIIVK